MSYTVSPSFPNQFFDDDGNPADSYQLFTYQTGTTTKIDTYSDSTGTLNTNPILLDAAGRADIYLPPVPVKFVLAPPTDTDPPTSPLETWDPVTPIPVMSSIQSVEGVAGETLSAKWVYLSQGDGTRTAGRWYKSDATLDYASISAGQIGYVPSTIATGSSGTVYTEGRITGLSGLTAGLDYYLSGTPGAITATAPTNARIVGVADSTTSIIMSARAATRDANETYSGIVSRQAQTWDGVKTFRSAPLFYAGTGTARAAIGGRLDGQADTLGIPTVTNTETTLFTYTVPANTLANVGDALNVFWRVTFNADTDVKLMKLHFGSTALTVVNGAANLASSQGLFSARIMRIDGTNQLMSASGFIGNTTAGGSVLGYASADSPTETLSGDVVLKLTGQNSTDTTGGAITAWEWRVELDPEEPS